MNDDAIEPIPSPGQSRLGEPKWQDGADLGGRRVPGGFG